MPINVKQLDPDDAADEIVRRQALLHLAAVLGVETTSLLPMPSLHPDLGVRQFDIIRRELEEVADAQLLSEMTAGTLLTSLDMYCVQMARCSRIDSVKVARVLGVEMNGGAPSPINASVDPCL